MPNMENNTPKIAARMLRKNQTPEEKKMWERIKNRKLENIKFLRQHVIKFRYDNKDRFYICDFYCAEKKLVIEIDGGIHKDQVEKDQFRDDILNKLGYKVVRFTNTEVNDRFDNVMNNIRKLIE
jgi:very-short-patch-repair endonuclease